MVLHIMFEMINLSFSLKKGGSVIAVGNLNKLLFDEAKCLEACSINQDTAGKSQFIKRLISFGLGKLHFDGNPIKHFLNLVAYETIIKSVKSRSQSNHHLNWARVNDDTLSVYDLDKISAGIVNTLHDARN